VPTLSIVEPPPLNFIGGGVPQNIQRLVPLIPYVYAYAFATLPVKSKLTYCIRTVNLKYSYSINSLI